jgi:hypothetical protein
MGISRTATLVSQFPTPQMTSGCCIFSMNHPAEFPFANTQGISEMTTEKTHIVDK